MLGETILNGDSIEVAVPLYLASLALSSFAWSLSWWCACKSDLISPSITVEQKNPIEQAHLFVGDRPHWMGCFV